MLTLTIVAGVNLQAQAAEEAVAAQPDAAAAAQTTAAPNPAPAVNAATAPATANKSICPCDFTNGFPNPAAIKNGGISCIVNHSLKQDPSVVRLKPAYNITLAAAEFGDSGKPAPASLFANWSVREEIFYNTDPAGAPVRMCLDQAKGKQEVITNDDQFKACINDIKQTALAAGINCSTK